MDRSQLLVTHARLATLGDEPTLVEDGALCIQDGRIAALGPTAELTARYPAAERWDAGGQLVLPGAICAHTHFYGAFARGMAVPGEPAANFCQILERLETGSCRQWYPRHRYTGPHGNGVLRDLA